MKRNEKPEIFKKNIEFYYFTIHTININILGFMKINFVISKTKII